MAKRLRWPDDLDPQLRKWLTRVMRVHAHITTTLAIYTTAAEVGGCSLGNDNYQRRVKRQDRTILHDALALAVYLPVEGAGSGEDGQPEIGKERRRLGYVAGWLRSPAG